MIRIPSASTVVAIALAFAAGAHAQSALTGKWQEITSSGLQIELDLAATSTAVAGTFTVRGRPLTIADGTVSKNMFTFKATLADQPEGFTGELVGNEITLWRDRNGRSDAVVLKRSGPVLTGKWQGKTPNGADLVLDLTATDKKLTGTLTRDAETTTITDGTVSGNTFAFKATLNGQTETFTGELAADVIKVWLDRQGPEKAAVLKRVKK